MPAPTTGTPVVNSTWRLDVDLDVNGGGNWVQVKGISNFTPGLDNTVQDMSDYDTSGWGADAVTFRKFKLSGDVNRNQYSGVFDVGQEYLRTSSEQIPPRLVHVRWYQRISGGLAYDGWVLVQWSDKGGDAPGLSSVSFECLGQGARTPIANPYSATAVPVINSLSPATGPIAGGTNVTITGSGFTGVNGATGVKFGTVNATEYTVVTDSKIVAKAPATTAGVKQVIVTNTNGPSVDTTYDDYTYV